jgi:hypothetical protein
MGAGRVRKRLARMLAERFKADGYEVRIDPEKLWPAEGFWRSDSRADCHRWDGVMEVYDERGPTVTYYTGDGTVKSSGKWQPVSLGSYSRMTDCLKGFKYERDGMGIEVWANE